jgi:hypothetical protein
VDLAVPIFLIAVIFAVNKKLRMGSFASSQITISVDAPSSRLYDFHRKNDPPSTSQKPLAYPSFLRRTHSNAIEYAHRCKFNDREFEIDFR